MSAMPGRLLGEFGLVFPASAAASCRSTNHSGNPDTAATMLHRLRNDRREI
jgi:hypothetical protein